jgi:ribonuclease HI
MEVFYPDWLANPVLVLKKNNKWRMCIDYTSLNKACTKDPFALPRIDQVIDSTAGCELLSFLDAYSGYHQIKLDPADRLKTAFITPFGAFCYITMTFGLRNAGATFQRCMQKCLLPQLGRNAHVYVDDIVVKTEKRGTLLEDLKETFANLRRFQIKLNPEKCVFGVPAGQLLGFLVSERGIECNPVKIKAIERMKKPTRLRDVQKFTGCLASLSRFISRLGEKALPLYQLMKKTTCFEWTDQADEAFLQLKRMMSTPPVLAAPAAKEPMFLYIAAANRVISTVVVVERPEAGKAQPVQRPVYYLSEVLSASKQNYPHYQKMCYGVYYAAKKLKQYFQEHTITVVCTAPLAEIMGNRDASGRVAKWAIELAPHTILYQPRTAIKSQALADFLVDWAESQYLPPAPDSTHWRMHFDGSKMRTGLGAGIVLTSPKGDKLKYTLQIHFAASNNVAEYEALIHGLRLAKEIGIRRILCYGDSDLVVQQSSGDWDAKDANMASYRFLVQQISGHFDGCEFLHVPRADNEAADALAWIGSTRQAIPAGISLEYLRKPSIKPSPESESIFVPADPGAAGFGSGTSAAGPGTSACGPGAAAPEPGSGAAAVSPGTSTTQQAAADSNPPPPNPATLVPVAVMTVVEAPSWAQPILNFLVSRELPADEILARQVQRRAAAYTVINRELVRRSSTGVFQRYVEPEKGIAILRDIHQGECGHHAASRALVAKAFRHGFFWPTALDDAKELVRKCKGCQRFISKQHLPASALKTIPLTWSFAVWGLDMVGPFKTACDGMTYLLVAVDKFMKWIEARPIKKLNGPTAITSSRISPSDMASRTTSSPTMTRTSPKAPWPIST